MRVSKAEIRVGLTAALALLRGGAGWVQKTFEKNACYCAAGAIRRATSHTVMPGWVWKYKSKKVTLACFRTFARILDLPNARSEKVEKLEGAIWDWNDCKRRTPRSVVAAFKKVLASL